MTAPHGGAPQGGAPQGGQPDAFDAALRDQFGDGFHDGFGDGVSPAAPRGPSTGGRVAAVVGGLLLVLVVTFGTAGVALAAFVGMGIAALLQRRRGRPYTRVAGWLGAVIAPTVALIAFMGVLTAFVPRGVGTQLQQEMQADANRPRQQTAADSLYARISPAGKAASDAQAKAILGMLSRSSGVVLALLGFAAVIGSATWGLTLGTMAWGSGTVLQFGLTGRWPAGSARLSHALRPPAVPPVRDAFDAIR